MGYKVESLDTNAILRVLLQDVPEQKRKVAELLTRPNVIYRLDPAVIIEAVYVMERAPYDCSREQVRKKLGMLFKLMNIMCDIEAFSEAADMYVEHPKLSFVDCYLAAVAEKNNASPLWTFDKDMAKQLEVAEEV